MRKRERAVCGPPLPLAASIENEGLCREVGGFDIEEPYIAAVEQSQNFANSGCGIAALPAARCAVEAIPLIQIVRCDTRNFLPWRSSAVCIRVAAIQTKGTTRSKAQPVVMNAQDGLAGPHSGFKPPLSQSRLIGRSGGGRNPANVAHGERAK